MYDSKKSCRLTALVSFKFEVRNWTNIRVWAEEAFIFQYPLLTTCIYVSMKKDFSFLFLKQEKHHRVASLHMRLSTSSRSKRKSSTVAFHFWVLQTENNTVRCGPMFYRGGVWSWENLYQVAKLLLVYSGVNTNHPNSRRHDRVHTPKHTHL